MKPTLPTETTYINFGLKAAGNDLKSRRLILAESFRNKSDQIIWEELKAGDEKAFQFIYDTNFERLINYGVQYVRDVELVKDCIQDLFVDIRTKRKSLCEITYSIKYYLFKSLRRRLLNKINRAKKISLEDCFEKYTDFEIKVSKEVEMINSQLSKCTKERLQKAINELPKKQKETLLCYYYEGFSYEEITSILGFSRIEYARITVSKAIKKLKKHIFNYENNIVSALLGFILLF